MLLSENRSRFAKRDRWYTIGGVLLVLVLLIPSPQTVKQMLIQHGFVAHSTDSSAKNTQLLNAVIDAPLKYLNADTNIPNLQLDIKYQDWMRLVADRKQALQEGQIPDKRAEVKANVSYLEDKYVAKVRLQGDLLDHVEAPQRWSLRVELKGKSSLLKVKRFALLSPNVRGNHAPLLFSKTLDIAGFDIISPQHIPVNLTVNGTPWGLMLLEEVFAKELLANNNRTEGLILKLEQAVQNEDNNLLHKVFRPKVFQQSDAISNPGLNQQRKIALTLLSDFLNQRRSASDVFDSRKLGQYLATVDLWSAWHAFSWNNLRFYYNPHTAKLEPIQSDEALSPVPDKILLQPVSTQFPLIQAMLADNKVKDQYDQSLNHLITLVKNKQLPEQLESLQQQVLKKMQHGSPLLQGYKFDSLIAHAQCLADGCRSLPTMPTDWHRHVNTFSAELPWDLASEFRYSNNEKQLQLRNNNQVPVSIIDLIVSDKWGSEISLTDSPELPFTLTSNQADDSLIIDNAEAYNIQLLSRQGDKKLQTYRFNLGESATSFLPRPLPMQDEADVLAKYDFIQAQQDGWYFKPGNWQINDYLITPADTRVYMPADTKLKFSKQGGMLIFGQLDIEGSAQYPVTLAGNSNNTWQGIAVFGSGSKSSIHHLNMTASASPKQGNWQPRGALYMHDVDLEASDMTLRDNRSEDALNMINSTFNLTKLVIENAYSDGFDCDFCKGRISDSQFNTVGVRSGGDAIDISGSDIIVRNSQFSQIRDKAISAGEHSSVDAAQIQLNSAAFGIVAKDGSQVIAADINAVDIKHYLFMSYMKKPFFGGASLQASSFNCDNCSDISMLQKNNFLSLDGQKQTAKKLNVKKLYTSSMRSDKPK
ncbi:CotH kinase family protein [Moritella sp. 24]|uniref:CotH kinase family protein n=1 Tax=Moritella sp. 24 TaxID=2746230 RepID=UPI001BA73831|nr:CotH kinase family protein [Moritella sp. 24]QUM74851.1 CotH kinase family protein [Moritella sp. 24]